jgi:hypothetical protein
VVRSFFLASCLFLIWWQTPQILDYYGVKVSQMLPLDLGTAGIYGAFSDKVIDYAAMRVGKFFKSTE